MRRTIEQWRRKLTGLPRLAAASLASIMLLAGLFATISGQSIVTISDSQGNTHTLLTASETPTDMIRSVGLDVGLHDQVVYTPEGNASANLTIVRSFPVSVAADGQFHSAEFVDGTVADLLTATQVELNGEDFVEPSLDTPLTEGMEAVVHRVTYEEEKLREEVPEDVVTPYVDALMAAEPETAFRKSPGGIYDVTYRHTLVDGEPVESEILSLLPVIQPRDPGSTAFEPGVPCSTIEGFDDVELGADGLPTHYTRLMESAVATAYSSSGGRGSSGLGLYCGTVAVNPNVIPYGTRMYITSADQSFVYGFAIATDTGGAMMEGRVDVDLYFATNAECLRFGKRALNIYILD